MERKQKNPQTSALAKTGVWDNWPSSYSTWCRAAVSLGIFVKTAIVRVWMGWSEKSPLFDCGGIGKRPQVIKISFFFLVVLRRYLDLIKGSMTLEVLWSLIMLFSTGLSWTFHHRSMEISIHIEKSKTWRYWKCPSLSTDPLTHT